MNPPEHSAVLVVDDHELIRNLVVRVLERAGFAVIAVETGLAAIELVRQQPLGIGCVLQDLSMPDMRGEEVIARLHEIDPLLPIVAFSAEDPHCAAERLANLTVSGFLQKPFQIDALLDMLAGLTATTRE